MKKVRAYGKDHFLFDVDEYVDDYVDDWRKGEQGDWVLTDDRQVCQILRKTEVISKEGQKNTFIVTVLGTKNVERSTLGGDPPEDIYSLSGKRPWQRESDELNFKEILFAEYLLTIRGIQPWQAYKLAFDTPLSRSAYLGASRLLKQKRIQNYVVEEISKLMEAKGVTRGELIDWAWEKLQNKKGNEAVKERLWTKLCEMQAMFPQNVKTSESLQLFQGWTPVAKQLMSGDPAMEIPETAPNAEQTT